MGERVQKLILYRSPAQNKFWKKKADLSDKHLDNIADDGGEEHIDMLDQIEEEEISCEVPEDLEDIVAEIVAEMDDLPARETDAVSTNSSV